MFKGFENIYDPAFGRNGFSETELQSFFFREPPVRPITVSDFIHYRQRYPQLQPPEIAALKSTLNQDLDVIELSAHLGPRADNIDVRLTADAITALGYAQWGVADIQKQPDLAHQMLIKGKHNGESTRLAAVLKRSDEVDKQLSPVVAGVVTLTHAKRGAPNEWNSRLSDMSIGFTDLMVLTEKLQCELGLLSPDEVGELTLFTIAQEMRIKGIKEHITFKLLSSAIEAAKKKGIKRLFAIMPDIVRKLLPEDSYIIHPNCRRLTVEDGEVASATVQEVYKNYPGYWLNFDPVVCEFIME